MTKNLMLFALFCVAAAGCGRKTNPALTGCYIAAAGYCAVPLAGCTTTGGVVETPCHSEGVLGCCTASDGGYTCYYNQALATESEKTCTGTKTWSKTVPN